ncbi:hypothetical protein CcI49_26120 [Frankia sp. CcI49]|uniref:pentapeptide repeat-containing protein n=1 Tax=Frankia sp. CcI49 TaxID=1745382 RepID=UPI000978B455|nr:pentapeptide repeat-containing protein [Frankia sp. CcI49]ONH56927.1 hypothetical protein CcI49_26120 [Frankia sp. CcI49]
MADNGGARRRAGRRWLWIVAAVAAVGAVAAVVGIWHLPGRMYPPGTDGGAEARAALQGGLLTAAAALTAVAGALIALDETRQANANTHVRELYATAIGQLGADSPDVRLGGIYALERIARDSADDQRTVVEVLSAFVREHTRFQTTPASPGRRSPPGRRWADRPPARPHQLGTDVQAALTVLGRLPIRAGVPRADLSGANLTGARLNWANLTSARLDGVVLTGAKLDRSNLSYAHLGRANLTDANLRGANLTGARLVGADLTRTGLIAANLTEARLFGANLTGARLVGADLTRAGLFAANLVDAQDLVQEQVDAAFGNRQTQLPVGQVRPAHWQSETPPAGA